MDATIRLPPLWFNPLTLTLISKEKTMYDLSDDTEIIFQYTRQNMIDDGFLVEVPINLTQEAGFRFPVGILIEPWDDCVAWTDADSERQQVFQDQTGRLWDVLNMLRFSMRGRHSDTLFFTVSRIPKDGQSTRPKNVRLKAVIGPGDDPKPVITVMFPNQD
jgi:hypothetical protein